MIRRLVAFAAVFVLASAGRSPAQTTYTWNGTTTGEFLTASNWTPSGSPATGGPANQVFPNDPTVLNTAQFSGTNYGTVGVNTGLAESQTLGQIVVGGSNVLTLGSSATATGLGDRFLTLRGTTTSPTTPSAVLSAVGGNVTIQDRLDGAAADARLIVRLGAASGGNIITAATGRTITITAQVADISPFTGGTAYGIFKEGAGDLVLGGNNTYTGQTTITNGRLLVNNTAGSGTGTGNVTVGYNSTTGTKGTLGGSGTISGSVQVTAVDPSNYGILTAGTAADRTLNTGAVDVTGHYRVQLFGTAAEQGSQVSATGVIALSSTASVLELDLNGQTVPGLRATGAKSYTALVGSGGISGVFSNAPINGGAIDFTALGFDLTDWTIQYNANSVVLNFTPVPEPASVLAVGVAGLGLVRLIRRWRKRQLVVT